VTTFSRSFYWFSKNISCLGKKQRAHPTSHVRGWRRIKESAHPQAYGTRREKFCIFLTKTVIASYSLGEYEGKKWFLTEEIEWYIRSVSEI
jgi:hypothetical protein